MPTIYRGVTRPDGSRAIECSNPDAGAKTGRWTYNTNGEPEQYPDRCEDCHDHDTMAHYPATHYRREVTWATVGEFSKLHHKPVQIVTYYGACSRCLRRHPEARLLPPTARTENRED